MSTPDLPQTTSTRRGQHEAELQDARQIAESLGLPYVDLFETEIDPQHVSLVTPELCRRYRVMPITVSTYRIRLAMIDPTNVIAMDDVASATGRTITPFVASSEGMDYALARFARHDDQIDQISSELRKQAEMLDLDASNRAEVDESSEDAPIVHLVNLIITQAIQDRASDIHIEPSEASLHVRYRIDGILHSVQNAPAAIAGGVVSRLKIMAGIDIAERRRPQDGRMSVRHEGRNIDLRVATLPTVTGEKVVLRILDSSAGVMRLRDLHLSERNLQVFSESFQKPHGMLLVTGPTGSGKSTTLYTTLHEISSPAVNVITVENPVEYRMEGINQIQVNPAAGLTFGSALRSILRSDPDVVLVGEIRDAETAQISFEAALTGHLVLSTLHTNDAPSSTTRLIEMGIEPFLVASGLDSVMAQRLARRLCPDCVQQQRPDPELLREIGLAMPDGEGTIGVPRGCVRCAGTGYRGRITLQEVLHVSEEVERMVVARASSFEIRRLAIEQGMIPLKEDGWAKVLAGLTSLEEVLRVSV